MVFQNINRLTFLYVCFENMSVNTRYFLMKIHKYDYNVNINTSENVCLMYLMSYASYTLILYVIVVRLIRNLMRIQIIARQLMFCPHNNAIMLLYRGNDKTMITAYCLQTNSTAALL